MSSPTQYKVYLQYKGETTRDMLAQFMEYTDAVHYAHTGSVGKYRHPQRSLKVTYRGAKQVRFCQGERK